MTSRLGTEKRSPFLNWYEYVIIEIQTDKPGHFSIPFIILFATAHVTLQQQLLQALDKYEQQEAYYSVG